jgi:hypothetical protein
MAEPENLVLDHLRAIRGEMAKMGEVMQSLNVEVTAIRQHLASFMTIQEHDHGDLAAIKARLEPMEKRLELAD